MNHILSTVSIFLFISSIDRLGLRSLRADMSQFVATYSRPENMVTARYIKLRKSKKKVKERPPTVKRYPTKKIYKLKMTYALDLLSKDQLRILRKAFDTLDPNKKGKINAEDLGTILDILGQHQNDQALRDLVASVDREGKGTLNFEELCELGVKFMGEEEEDVEKVREELREAFRLYDKEGNGYITTEVLREILQELDNNLTGDDLDQIIEEVDADGSGTVDFEEFMEMMIG